MGSVMQGHLRPAIVLLITGHVTCHSGRVLSQTLPARKVSRGQIESKQKRHASASIVATLANAIRRGDCTAGVTYAKQVLKKYPDRSPESAYANLLIGACLVRAKRWPAAIRSLQLATPLSGKAIQTRRQLLRYAVDRDRDESRSFGAGTTGSSWNPVGSGQWNQPLYIPVEPAYGRVPSQAVPSGTGKASKAPKPSAPEGPQTTLAVTPALTYGRTDESKSYSGLKQSDGSVGVTEIKANGIYRHNMPLAYAKGDPLVVSFPLEMNYVQESVSGEETSFRRATDSETSVAGTVSELGGSSKYFLTTMTPSLSVPLSSTIEVEGSLLYSWTLPDFSAAGKSSRRMPGGSVAIELGSLNMSGSVSYDERLNSNDEKMQSTLSFRGNLALATGSGSWSIAAGNASTDVPEDFRSDAQAAGKTDATVAGQFSGESADYRISGTYAALESFPGFVLRAPLTNLSGSADVEVPYGVFSVGGAFTYSMLSDIRVGLAVQDADGVEGKEIVSADASQWKISGRFKLTTVKWFAFSMGYEYISTTYSVGKSAFQKDFLRSQPDLILRSTLGAAISREF